MIDDPENPRGNWPDRETLGIIAILSLPLLLVINLVALSIVVVRLAS